jgi:hypothetical protein
MKANLDRSWEVDFDTALAHEAEATVATTLTADHREAVAAFVARRKPVFEGR